MSKQSSVSVFMAIMFVLSTAHLGQFAPIDERNAIADRPVGHEMMGHTTPTADVVQYTESLSDNEFLLEHEMLKANLGDIEYLAFRKAEMAIKGAWVAQQIVGHSCEPGLGQRHHNVSRTLLVSDGQLTHEVAEDGQVLREVSEDELKRLHQEEQAEAKRRQDLIDFQILRGEVSVRSMRNPCTCEEMRFRVD